MDNNFLAINKEYLNYGFKSIDLLIISQIEEFERSGYSCYVTNQQFAQMFGESESTIKRSLDKLESLNIIKRNTSFIKNNGRSNKQRILSVNNKSKWKVHNELTIMEGSNVDNGRFKNEEWKVHNEPIKDNIKENIKEKYNYDDDEFDYIVDGIVSAKDDGDSYDDIVDTYGFTLEEIDMILDCYEI